MPEVPSSEAIHWDDPFGGLVILAITLAWVVLQVVLVDALGLASFLPLVLALAFAFAISRRLQLLEEHTFIDLPGPEKLVFLDGLHCRLQSGSICHELVNLPPGISLRPQECELRRWWSPPCYWRVHRTNHTIHPSLTWRCRTVEIEEKPVCTSGGCSERPYACAPIGAWFEDWLFPLPPPLFQSHPL